MNKKLAASMGLFWCFWWPVIVSFGQSPQLHSHNDYLQNVPLWEAVAVDARSIEVDLVWNGEGLFVAHELESVQPHRTLEALYLNPIIEGIKNGTIPNTIPFFLLVDLKSDPLTSLNQLQRSLTPYQSILYSKARPSGLKLVISGNRPPLSTYDSYPEYLFFDHQEIGSLKEIQSDRIAMVSLPYPRYSSWIGKGRMVEAELQAVREVIQQVHGVGKPIRFWATPDSKSAWKALVDLGVDYVNTDKLAEANLYLKDLETRVVSSSIQSDLIDLNRQQDDASERVDHVILFIGDGTGLAQISAGMYANGGKLNITNLTSVGLAKTQSSDDFTTDSGAGGTALASGQKTRNRAIGVDSLGRPIPSMSHLLKDKGFATGIVSSDHVTGATGAAFYGHQPDRDYVKELTEDLYRSSLDLFIGSGKSDFIRHQNHSLDSLRARGFHLVNSLKELRATQAARVGYFASDHGLPAIHKGRTDYLSQSTAVAMSFLGAGKRPFFLMVENGHIDSGGHVNSAQMIVDEVIDFDRAVGEALQFAQRNPNTLIVITADHETGGVTMPQGNLRQKSVELEFSTEDHTAIMVPVFAYGPHSREFAGVYENTEVFEKIWKILNRYH
jgi:alkaline phosphatase